MTIFRDGGGSSSSGLGAGSMEFRRSSSIFRSVLRSSEKYSVQRLSFSGVVESGFPEESLSSSERMPWGRRCWRMRENAEYVLLWCMSSSSAVAASDQLCCLDWRVSFRTCFLWVW